MITVVTPEFDYKFRGDAFVWGNASNLGIFDGETTTIPFPFRVNMPANLTTFDIALGFDHTLYQCAHH